MMTTLLVVNYGRFDSRVLLTNLAYDVALSIRTAQTYGISVQGQPVAYSTSNLYQFPYGVSLCAVTSCADPAQSGITSFTNKQVLIFADANPVDLPMSRPANDKVFDRDDFRTNSYNIKRGAIIKDICDVSGATPTCGMARVDITFLRPNPDAIICISGTKSSNPSGSPQPCGTATTKAVRIDVQSNDGSTRSILVNQTGQISVEN